MIPHKFFEYAKGDDLEIPVLEPKHLKHLNPKQLGELRNLFSSNFKVIFDYEETLTRSARVAMQLQQDQSRMDKFRARYKFRVNWNGEISGISWKEIKCASRDRLGNLEADGWIAGYDGDGRPTLSMDYGQGMGGCSYVITETLDQAHYESERIEQCRKQSQEVGRSVRRGNG